MGALLDNTGERLSEVEWLENITLYCRLIARRVVPLFPLRCITKLHMVQNRIH